MRAWCARPTRPAGATTSPSSPSGSRTRGRRCGRARGSDAGRSGGRGGGPDRGRVAAAPPTPRRRDPRGRIGGERAAAAASPPRAAPARQGRWRRSVVAVIGWRGLVYGRAPGLLPRHRLRRPRRPVPRPALRPAARHQALLGGLRGPGPGGLDPASRQDSAIDHTLRFHGDAVSLLEDLQRAAERSARAEASRRKAAEPGRTGTEARGQGGGAKSSPRAPSPPRPQRSGRAAAPEGPARAVAGQ